MDPVKIQEMIRFAKDQLKCSYAPYSNFLVGAALLAKDGRLFGGCNVENASYGATNCAERTAFFKAVSEGVKDFEAICIMGGPKGVITEFTPPCGICRQIMSEFCDPKDFSIILAKDEDEYRLFRLGELLPAAFGPENLD